MPREFQIVPGLSMLARILEMIRRPHLRTRALATFHKFPLWKGDLESGFIIDFTGQRISRSFDTAMPQQLIRQTYPVDREEVFEWLGLLEAVLQSGDTFMMIEAGAGYGRWSVAAACALRSLGRQTETHFIAIEAEPTHFSMIAEHFRNNGVDPGQHTFIEAAVAAADGETHFIVGSPREWYGQAIVPAGFKMADFPDSHVVKVPTISLRTVLRDLATVDLLDMDVQGVEGEAISADIDVLSQKVKRAVIATHSRDIHHAVGRALRRTGWHCLADYGWRSAGGEQTPFGRIVFTDGVHYWINPAFVAR